MATVKSRIAFSILVPTVPRRPEQILPFAALTAWTPAARLWQGQSLLVEPYQGFAHAAGAGFRVPVGLGVALMGLRNPYEAAGQARSLATVTGHPVVAGFGPGAPVFQRAVLGRPYPSPLTACREYLTAVRQLLGGGVVEVAGEYVNMTAQLTPTPAPPVELGLGVLRPGMARLAGEVADVAITWLTPAAYLRSSVVPALRAGAEAANRPMPRLTAIVPMALGRPDRTPVEIALASNAGHLQAPHYRDMLRRAGAGIGPDDSLEDAGKALVGCDGFLSGSPEQLAELVAEYADAGVDEIVINVTGVHALYGQQAALAELRTILAEVAR
ncbi:LLM class flavin-dependent oxidoreductase [Polymorphospora rubra]|uniref:LLM class flavin-dependent oxidoreductase n=1 Tax=Polymorphospora rubra TaxID=338584 RepID=UPI0033F7DACB